LWTFLFILTVCAFYVEQIIKKIKKSLQVSTFHAMQLTLTIYSKHAFGKANRKLSLGLHQIVHFATDLQSLKTKAAAVELKLKWNNRCTSELSRMQ